MKECNTHNRMTALHYLLAFINSSYVAPFPPYFDTVPSSAATAINTLLEKGLWLCFCCNKGCVSDTVAKELM